MFYFISAGHIVYFAIIRMHDISYHGWNKQVNKIMVPVLWKVKNKTKLFRQKKSWSLTNKHYLNFKAATGKKKGISIGIFSDKVKFFSYA